ncbi:hypothetical protein GCM10010377_44360 [Streptomyces viridiviolaceus]|uniref:SMI1/KNR4 family protein n=1 Tax=Streptomyces viridiviolaceus TaxID=68282 RepID=A0ABW2EI72_9ACTN|nr:SMI1/KNR4 family protein [Streptomyces viridiviolaceus]GHB48557.1 hypothetical protein GCM10010377_44360 [Streptomyces viridiviolaceus]
MARHGELIARTNTAWDTIEAWMERHAPQSHGYLRAGATEEQISVAEGELGCRLPLVMRTLYLRHDGQLGCHQDDFGGHPHADGPLPKAPDDRSDAWEGKWKAAGFMGPGGIHWGYNWLRLDEAVGCAWQIHGDTVPGGDPLRRYVPFMADALDAGMFGVFVDANDGPTHGHLGTWGDAEMPEVTDTHLVDHLEDLARALTTRTALRHGEVPCLRGGALTWIAPSEMDEEQWEGFVPVGRALT